MNMNEYWLPIEQENRYSNEAHDPNTMLLGLSSVSKMLSLV